MTNLEKFQMFMKYNLEIKRAMTECSPDSTSYIGNIDNDIGIAYGDKLYASMKKIEYFFLKILEVLPGYKSLYDEYFKNVFVAGYEAVAKNSGNLESLKRVYREYLSDIRPEIIDEIGRNCKGYSIFGFLNFKHAKSINELLHMMHQSMINNENFYKEMPLITSKRGAVGPINLYGNESEVGRSIFGSFDSEILTGVTDILSISDEEIIMMVRDYGHALTIEVGYENESYYVRYFIPKICHVGMVNQLPGVRKVNDKSEFTTGVFRTSKENLCVDLVEFIKMVPRDKHMSIEGGPFYREPEQSNMSY